MSSSIQKIRSGAAATELAIVLPLLIVLSLAAVDFGRFAYIAIAMDNAVRVGAEHGATRSFTSFNYDNWEDNVKERVSDELADIKAGWLTDLEVTVSTSSTSNSLARVNVQANGNFSTIIDWPFLSDATNIRRQISIRQFR